MIQSQDELNQWYKNEDPWDYETTADDIKRRDMLLNTLPNRKFKNVLDIGCGHGYITRELPGENIIGIDLSQDAINQAKELSTKKGKNIRYLVGDFFDLPNSLKNAKFDLIVVTGVLYPQYIGKSFSLSYLIIDELLEKNGILASVHINEWYSASFPYLKLEQKYYDYRTFTHDLQVYTK